VPARLEGLFANSGLEVGVCSCDSAYLDFVELTFDGGTLFRIRLCEPVEILEDFGVPICDPALLKGRTLGAAICDAEDLAKTSSAELLLTRLIDL